MPLQLALLVSLALHVLLIIGPVWLAVQPPPPPAPAAGLANGASLDGTTSTSGLTGISHPPAFVMSNGTPGVGGNRG